MTKPVSIGVLALQGDFAAHAKAFGALSCDVREIRRPAEIAETDGIVIPGGETTTLIKLLRAEGFWDVLIRAPGTGRPIFGTCAGLILLAKKVVDPVQASLGLLPVVVRRNAYGRQVDSFVVPGQVRMPGDGELKETEFVFIRAPRIDAVDASVEVLARHEGAPVLVRSGWVLGASFHPELTADGIVAGLFVALVEEAREVRPGGNGGNR